MMRLVSIDHGARNMPSISNTEWQPRPPAGWIGRSTFDTLFAQSVIEEPGNGMKTREVLS